MLRFEKDMRNVVCPMSLANPSGHSLCRVTGCGAWRRVRTGAKVENNRGQLVERDVDGTGRWQYQGYCGMAGPAEEL